MPICKFVTGKVTQSRNDMTSERWYEVIDDD